MKIEFANRPYVSFSKLYAGQCFLDENDDVCLVCEDGWVVILATGAIFELKASDSYEVRPISAKVVVLETK